MPCRRLSSTSPQENSFTVPFGLLTLMSDSSILVQTLGLLQTTYPEMGLYLELVVP